MASSQLFGGSNLPLEYEDVVGQSWQLFPDEFGLRQSAHQYSDSSDPHPPLAGPLPDQGYVLSGNQGFRLTGKGNAYATELERAWKGLMPLTKATAESTA